MRGAEATKGQLFETLMKLILIPTKDYIPKNDIERVVSV